MDRENPRVSGSIPSLAIQAEQQLRLGSRGRARKALAGELAGAPAPGRVSAHKRGMYGGQSIVRARAHGSGTRIPE